MSSPMEKLKQAKEMLDMGLIDNAMYEQIRNQVLTQMGLTTTPPSSSNPLVEPPVEDNPIGGNPLGESSSQTILGTVPESSNPLETSNRTILGEVETVFDSSNPLDSNNQTILGAIVEEGIKNIAIF